MPGLLETLVNDFLINGGFEKFADEKYKKAKQMQQRKAVGFNDFMENPEADSSNVSQGFNLLKSLGPITGLGSPLWDKGLDIDLQKGDPVKSPVSGLIDFVGKQGGFGNQVRVKGDDGREYWLSHLDAIKANPGQRIAAGQDIGVGGNTGNVIPGPGGDGSHLDLTVRKDNKFLDAGAVRDLLNSFG